MPCSDLLAEKNKIMTGDYRITSQWLKEVINYAYSVRERDTMMKEMTALGHTNIKWVYRSYLS